MLQYPNKNWSKLPHELFDLMADMGCAELRIFLYVLRHTWGFQEYDIPKKITVDEFMDGRKLKDSSRMDKGTGLTAKSVRKACADLVERGLLAVEVDRRDLGRIKKSYTICIDVLSRSSGRIDYYEYIESSAWMSKSGAAMKRAGFKCELCYRPYNLNVHHKSYENLGDEKPNELICLCRECHKKFHGIEEDE